MPTTYGRIASASVSLILTDILADPISSLSIFLMNNKPFFPNSDAKLRRTSSTLEAVVSQSEISLLAAPYEFG